MPLRLTGAVIAALCLLLIAAQPADARRARQIVKPPDPVGYVVDDRYPNLRMPEATATARAWPRARGRGLSGIVAPLAAKASEIVSACGSHVISGMRDSFVAGTRLISLHASGRAVDVAGNPSCIYGHLANWPGGFSTDYARVRHVHISYAPGGREWGARFAHHIVKHRHRRRA